MSWERMYDREEIAICACGNGFVKRNSYQKDDDWNRYRTGVENERIECGICADKYHIEHLVKHYNCMSWEGDGIVDTTYLVPNGETLNIKTEPESLPFENYVFFDKKAVALFTKEELQAAIDDMRNSKFSTRLSLETSQKLVSIHFRDKKSKKLLNVITALEYCIENYDSFEWTYDKVQAFRKEEASMLKNNRKELKQTLTISHELKFKTAR